MPLKQSEAVVLRSYPLREADLLVTFFTRNEGKISGVAKVGDEVAKTLRRGAGTAYLCSRVLRGSRKAGACRGSIRATCCSRR